MDERAEPAEQAERAVRAERTDRADESLVDRALLMRDVIDAQLESADRLRVGRVADVRIARASDGRARVVALALGPEALAGRVHRALRPGLRRFLAGRYEREVLVDEVEELGPTLRLRRPAASYALASGEAWVGERIVRRLPAAGSWPPPRMPAGSGDGRSAAVRQGEADGPGDANELRVPDLVGATVSGPGGERLGRVLDVELRPMNGFAIESLIVAHEPAIARLVLLHQVGPRPGGDHRLVPWRLVGEIRDHTVRLTSLPSEAGEATEGRPMASPEPEEAAGEARGATAASTVGERQRADAPPASEQAAEPERRKRRARQ